MAKTATMRRSNSAKLQIGGLEVPEVVTFRNWTPGTTYSKTIIVKNVSFRGIKLCYQQPSDQAQFHCSADQRAGDVFSLPAGTSLQLSVAFTPAAADREVRDHIALHGSDGPVLHRIPLVGALPLPSLTVDERLDFGVVATGKRASRTLRITNTGAAPTTWRCDTAAPFSVSPSMGELGPKETLELEVSLLPTTAKFLRVSAVLKSAVLGTVDSQIIDLVAVSKAPFLIMPEPAEADIDFGVVSPGQSVIRTLTLLNPTEVPCEFVAAYDADRKPNPNFSLSTQQGVIGPGEQQTLKISYSQTIAGSRDADAFHIRFAENQSIPVRVAAVVSRAQITVASIDSVFAAIAPGETACKKLLIHNDSSEPQGFQVNLLEHGVIRAVPSRGMIPARGSCEVSIEFAPKHPGYYHREVSVVYAADVPATVMDIVGTCSDDSTSHLEQFTQQNLDFARSLANAGLSKWAPSQISSFLRVGKLTLGDDGKVSISDKARDAAADFLVKEAMPERTASSSKKDARSKTSKSVAEPRLEPSADACVLLPSFAPPFELSAPQINFGKVPFGSRKAVATLAPQSITVKNNTCAALVLHCTAESNSPCFSVDKAQHIIPSKETCELKFSCAAIDGETSYSAVFEFHFMFHEMLDPTQKLDPSAQAHPLLGNIPGLPWYQRFYLFANTFDTPQTLVPPTLNISELQLLPAPLDTPSCATIVVRNSSNIPLPARFNLSVLSQVPASAVCQRPSKAANRAVQAVVSAAQHALEEHQTVPDHQIRCQPQSTLILPNEEQYVSVWAIGHVAGNASATLTCTFGGDNELDESVPIKASFFDSTLVIDSPMDGQPLLFAPITASETTQAECIVRNTSTVPLNFSVRVVLDDDGEGNASNRPQTSSNRAAPLPAEGSGGGGVGDNGHAGDDAATTGSGAGEPALLGEQARPESGYGQSLSVFQVEPSSGTLSANQALPLRFTFAPECSGEFRAKVVIVYCSAAHEDRDEQVGAKRSQATLTLVGEAGVGTLRAAPAIIDCGQCEVNHSISRTFVLLNPSDFVVDYDLVYSHPELISLSRTSGQLQPGIRHAIDVIVRPPVGGLLQASVHAVIKATGETFCVTEVKCTGIRPRLAVSDVQSRSFDKKRVWQMLHVPELNDALQQIAEPDEPIVFDLGSAPVRSSESCVTLELWNNGNCPCNYSFLFPDDTNYRPELWAEGDNPSEDQRQQRRLLDSKIFAIRPRRGQLEPDARCHVTIAYSHQQVSSDKLGIILRLSSRGDVPIELSGRTLAPDTGFLHLMADVHEFLPVRIGESMPPIQHYTLYNTGDRSLNFELDLASVKALNESSYDFRVLECGTTEGTVPAFGSVIIPWRFRPIEVRAYEAVVPITYHNGEESITEMVTFVGHGLWPADVPMDGCAKVVEASIAQGGVEGGAGAAVAEGAVDEEETGERPAPRSLPCTPLARLPNQLAQLSHDIVDFGAIPAFGRTTRLVFVENVSSQQLSFQWDFGELDKVMSAMPAKGVIEPGSSCACRIVFYANDGLRSYDGHVSCIVADAKALEEYFRQCREYDLAVERAEHEFTITDEGRTGKGRSGPFKNTLTKLPLKNSAFASKATDPGKAPALTATGSDALRGTSESLAQSGLIGRPSSASRLDRITGKNATVVVTDTDLRKTKYQALPPIRIKGEARVSAPRAPPPPGTLFMSVGAVVMQPIQHRMQTGERAHSQIFVHRDMANLAEAGLRDAAPRDEVESRLVQSIMSELLQDVVSDPDFVQAWSNLRDEPPAYFRQFQSTAPSSALTNVTAQELIFAQELLDNTILNIIGELEDSFFAE
eukprot:m.55983 g.55983  ORF g.55983 m.55983 type:complete len:1812 (-) comp6973_c0_seq1:276-5711(-)